VATMARRRPAFDARGNHTNAIGRDTESAPPTDAPIMLSRNAALTQLAWAQKQGTRRQIHQPLKRKNITPGKDRTITVACQEFPRRGSAYPRSELCVRRLRTRRGVRQSDFIRPKIKMRCTHSVNFHERDTRFGNGGTPGSRGASIPTPARLLQIPK
jgi:hypothetical protein